MRQHQMISRDAAAWDYAAVDPYEDDSLLELAGTSDMHHARALQKRLALTYAPEQPSLKLPIAQRALIIVSATCALWSMIGLTTVLAIHTF
jgi:hypothetical protein